jgi:hypothetical protein
MKRLLRTAGYKYEIVDIKNSQYGGSDVYVSYPSEMTEDEVKNAINSDPELKTSIINQLFDNKENLKKFMEGFDFDAWNEMLSENNYGSEQEALSDSIVQDDEFIDTTGLTTLKDFIDLSTVGKMNRLKIDNFKTEFASHADYSVKDGKIIVQI